MWKRKALCSNGRAVPVAHQEADQRLVGLVHLGLAAGERDAGAVDDREVVGHRVVEAHEAVVEDLDRRRELISVVTRPRAGQPRPSARTYRTAVEIQVGTSGWSYPTWRPGLLPAGPEAGRVPRVLRRALRHGRAEHDRLPAPGGRAVRAAGRRRCPTASGSRPSSRSRGPSASRSTSSASPRLGDRLGPIRVVVQSTRDDGAARGRCSPAGAGLELAFDFRHESWAGIDGVVTVNDFDAEPFRYIRLREPPYSDADLARARGQAAAAGLRLLPPRGRSRPRPPTPQRLRELLSGAPPPA